MSDWHPRSVTIAQTSTSTDIRVAPIESEPLAHFLPGTSVLHLGSSTLDALARGDEDTAAVVQRARAARCSSLVVPHHMADPVSGAVARLFDDVHHAGLRWIAVTDAHQMHPSSLALVSRCDAAIVRIRPDVRTARGVISEWVEQLATESPVWVEVLACLVPGMNDGDASIHDLSSWVLGHLGEDTPVHFASDGEGDVPAASLRRARSIGLGDGLNYVYTAPTADALSGTTFCPGCGERVIERQGHLLAAYRITAKGRCHACATAIAGTFDNGWRGPQAISLADI